MIPEIMAAAATDWDTIIVGAGLGGSVLAMRLAERGLSVLVLEAGTRATGPERVRSLWQRISGRLLRAETGAEPDRWPDLLARHYAGGARRGRRLIGGRDRPGPRRLLGALRRRARPAAPGGLRQGRAGGPGRRHAGPAQCLADRLRRLPHLLPPGRGSDAGGRRARPARPRRRRRARHSPAALGPGRGDPPGARARRPASLPPARRHRLPARLHRMPGSPLPARLQGRRLQPRPDPGAGLRPGQPADRQRRHHRDPRRGSDGGDDPLARGRHRDLDRAAGGAGRRGAEHAA